MHALFAALLLTAFTNDGTVVTIQEDRHWGYTAIDYGGQRFLEDNGSANNSVIKFAASPANILAGGAPFHGNWTLDEAAIFTNGNQLAAPAGTITLDPKALGGPYLVSQRSTIYGAVRVSTTTAVSEQGIDERFVFDGFNAAETVRPDSFYAALGTRANRLTDWAAFDAAGLLLASGVTAANNNAYTYLPAGTKSVAQYDPLAGNGMITTWGFSGPANIFLVDRIYDVKVYLDVAAQMQGPATKHFEISQTLRFFESPPETWQAAAVAVPEPSCWILALAAAVLLFRGPLAYVVLLCLTALRIVRCGRSTLDD